MNTAVARPATVLLAVLAAPFAWGQVAGEPAGTAEARLAPADSLVLVLNIISSTHARPATGVVLARRSNGGHALVLVPAGFVSAGDEIIVLDGGTEILRHGRSTRTVARSAEAGAALLEVEGLDRPGVRLSEDRWPPSGALEFAAWPAAEALAEGAPVTRQEIRLVAGANGIVSASRPEPPGVSGPLFDRCGQLAAFHLGGDVSRIISAGELLDFAAAFELPVASAACVDQAGAAAVDADKAREKGGDEDAIASKSEPGDRDPHKPSAPVSVGGKARSLTPWLIVFGMVLAGSAVLLRRRKRSAGNEIILAGHDSEGHRSRHRLALRPPGGETVLDTDGARLAFVIRDSQVTVSDTTPDGRRVMLAVAGTPCLPGEILIVEDGQEVRIGNSRYEIRVEVTDAGTTAVKE